MVHKSTILQSGGGGGSGTVTQINTGTGLTGGPITSSGTISVANGTANSLAGYNNSGVFSGVTVGTGLSLSAGTLTATGGGTGTVTSVSIVSANGFAGSVATATTTPAITLTTTITGIIKGNGTAISAATPGTDYEVPLTFSTGLTRTTNTITVNTSQNIATLSNLTSNGFVKTSGGTGALSVDTTSYQPTGNYITALTGDGTASGPGSVAFTLATVNGNVGSFGSSTSIPSFTVNAKGLVTAASGNVVIAPAGTLTGTTLASNVVTSSLTSTGTLTGGATGAGFTVNFATSTLSGSVPVVNGGTGQTSYTDGQLLIGNTSGNTLTKATITAGSGISVTNGNGSITIASTGASRKREIGFSVVTPVTGQQGSYSIFPMAGTITGWSIIADTGTATVRVWKIASGTVSPTVSNNINTSGVSLSTGTAIISSTTSDFTTTTVTANDMFAFEITAVSGATKLAFNLEITPT